MVRLFRAAGATEEFIAEVEQDIAPLQPARGRFARAVVS